MKNRLNKQLKDQSKVVETNIPLNINSKNTSNNEFTSSLFGCRTTVKYNPQHRQISQIESLQQTLIQAKKQNQPANNKIELQRNIRSKKNSMDFCEIIPQGIQGMKKKKLSIASEKFTYKKKPTSSLFQEFKSKSKNPSLQKIHRKNNDLSIEEKQLNREPALDLIFQDYQRGRLTLKELKSSIQKIIKKTKKNQPKQTKQTHVKKISCLQKNFTETNLLPKRVCTSQRGNIHARRHSYHHSNHQTKILTNTMVQHKFQNTELLVTNQETDQVLPFYQNTRLNHSSFQVKTSHSVRQIKKLFKIQREAHQNLEKQSHFSIQNTMALKIQIAWRQYQTKKIIKHFIQKNKTQNMSSCLKSMKEPHPIYLSSLRYSNQYIVPILGENNLIKNSEKIQAQRLILSRSNKEVSKQQSQNSIDDLQSVKNIQNKQQSPKYGLISPINSFTNVFQSKQVVNNKQSFQQSFNSSSQKTQIGEITFTTIMNSLKYRKKQLNYKKDKQISKLLYLYESDQIDEKTYYKQRDNIDKWYKNIQKELKQIMMTLTKGYQGAKKMINKQIFQQNEGILKKVKTERILKCLSETYLRNINDKHHLLDFRQQNKKSVEKLKYQSIVQDMQKLCQPLNINQTSSQSDYNAMQIQKQVRDEGSSTSIILFDQIYQQNHKLHQLPQNDKQDIFQFLFLDLCLELVLQNPKCTRIINHIQNLVNKNKIKQSKGIKTSLISTKEYLDKIRENVLESHRQILQNIRIVMGPTAAEMLKFMRQVNDSENQNQEENQTEKIQVILPLEIFHEVEIQNQLKLNRVYQQQQKQAFRIGFLRSLTHIHNKSIFDCLNENLEKKRPYGIWGKPFPWKNFIPKSKELTKQKLQKQFQVSIQQTIQCCNFLCGIITDKQQSIFGNHKITQDCINQLKQDRLSRMLAFDLLQNESRWVFYDDDQAQVLIQLSRCIQQKLLQQIGKEFHLKG